jgi:hypothetical protein
LVRVACGLLAFIFMVHFLMGVFDMGCMRSALLGWIATVLSVGIDPWLIAIVEARADLVLGPAPARALADAVFLVDIKAQML